MLKINVNKCKLKYNELLKREEKARLYIDNPNIDLQLIEQKYIPIYLMIVRQLSVLQMVIGECTEEEKNNGFNI